jgi:hypothetical protein
METLKRTVFILCFVFLSTVTYASPAHAFLGFIVAAISSFAATSLGSMIVSAFISFAVSSVVSSIFGGGKKRQASQAARNRSIMVNKNSSNEPIPVVYGRRRVGGTRVFISTTKGDINESGNNDGTNTLNMVLAMCEGQMGDLKKLYFNDKVIFDGTLTHGNSITGSNDVDGNKYEGTYEIQYFDGRDDQTVSSLMQGSVDNSTWTSNHRLRGIAYLAIKLTADAEKYQGGVPTITAEMDGRKITSTADFTSTVDGADQNPVDVLYDYLTNTRFGKGLTDTNGNQDIDRTSFTQARTDCGSFYKVNGAVETDIPLYENIQDIANTGNIQLIYANGQYKAKVKKQNESTAHTFTKAEMVGEFSLVMPSKRVKKNKITITYPDADADYNYNENMVIKEDSTYLAEDNNEVLESRIEMDLITSSTLADSFARYKLDFSRNTKSISFNAVHTKVLCEVGDIIEVTNSDYGLSNAKFRVLTQELTLDNTQQITAQSYNSSIELT